MLRPFILVVTLFSAVFVCGSSFAAEKPSANDTPNAKLTDSEKKEFNEWKAKKEQEKVEREKAEIEQWRAEKKDDSAVESPAPAQIEKKERPNAVSLELLGRGFVYSVNYDRLVTPWFGLGLGISVLGLTSGGDTVALYTFPIYSNLYLSTGNHRPFLTVGADFLVATASYESWYGSRSRSSATTALGVFGLGYELRSDSGFLFRVSPYGLVGSGGAAVWVGLSLGGAF